MKKTLVLLFIIWDVALFAQERYYTDPVKIPMLLSGSFAELRSNHFHSGIDIKTRGVTGVSVHAVAGGYISRIVVSPTGFGKALYISHPNGTTSVYAHLQSFSDNVERYVKNNQYEKKSFRVDLNVPENLFKIKQDEIIGKSGNSGSSGGPHLHFELRDTDTEEPLNPLEFKFPVEDTTPPRIFSLMVAPLNESSHAGYAGEKKTYPVIFKNGKYQLRDSHVIPAYGNIGIAIQANDYFDDSYNKCGIYSIQLKFDGELYYSFQMDRFSFAETRYINSHIDYDEYIQTNRRFHKTWIDPGNRLRIYNYLRQGGYLKVTDGNYHPVKIELKDRHGNTSVLEFSIVSRNKKIPRREDKFEKLLRFDRENKFNTGEVRIEFPEGSLYNDVKFDYTKIQGGKQFLSPVHVIHEETVPLHTSAWLSVKAENLEKRLQEKALLVNVDTVSGEISSAGGEFKNGWVTGNIRTFGNYAIAVDTVPPEIVPLSIKNNYEITETSQIRFKIDDELSGIQKIEGYIDGKWALFEYDPKSNLIVHRFDAERFEMGKRHQFVLTVTDYSGNQNTYEATFWK